MAYFLVTSERHVNKMVATGDTLEGVIAKLGLTMVGRVENDAGIERARARIGSTEFEVTRLDEVERIEPPLI